MIKDIIKEYLQLQNELGEELRTLYQECKEKLIEIENQNLEKVREYKEKNNQKILPCDEIVDESKLDVRLPIASLIKMIKLKLQTNECQNRGYILDSFPRSYNQL